MDNNHWGPIQGGEPAMDATDWRTQLPANPAGTNIRPLDPVSLDSSGHGHANVGNWTEEVYQKVIYVTSHDFLFTLSSHKKARIAVMETMKLIPETTENERDIEAIKELYLPRLNLAYQKLTARLQQIDSLPQQQKPEHYEKLKSFKTKIERAMSCLQVPKNSVSFCPGLMEKLAHFERQLKKLFSVNRPREPVSQLHQGQVPPSHMQTMQLPQSQITRVRFHENQMNPQLPSMNAQGTSLQETFISALSVEFQDLCLI